VKFDLHLIRLSLNLRDETKMSELTLTWGELREQARNHKDLSNDKKRDAVLAFDALQGLFGVSFFDDKQHPLFYFFFNRAGWVFEWAIWFANFLQSLNQHPDFPRLVNELKNPMLYGERMSILNIVEILLPLGFSFRLDSPININGGPKKPDLFVTLDASDPGFFIEVAYLAPSQKQWEADEAFHELWDNPVLHALTNCSGRLEKVLAPAHLQEVKQMIQMTIKKAESETGFETLEIAGTVRFAYATKTQEEKLQKWAETRGMKAGQLSGPGVNVSEFDRISFKLEKELKQVPHDRANVIVIYSHLFATPPSDNAAFDQFVHRLEDEVYKHPHVGYLVLVFRWTGGNNSPVLRSQNHICVNRCRFYFNSESMMLFKNRFAAKPMPLSVEERFLKAFMQSCG
jgi:hypothetical protein